MSAGAPEDLLPRVALGDEQAFQACVRRYGRLVHSIATRMLRDRRDIEDVCQETFVALWRNAAAFDPARASEATFVGLIARRRVIDRHRSKAARSLPPLDEEPSIAPSALEAHVDARAAMAALASGNADQQRVILMAAVHGMTHEEIAGALTIPLGTVKSHYARGIERVRRALTRDGKTIEAEG
jgi:RNA polymerase sigma-70 factor (ECF subfamily)